MDKQRKKCKIDRYQEDTVHSNIFRDGAPKKYLFLPVYPQLHEEIDQNQKDLNREYKETYKHSRLYKTMNVSSLLGHTDERIQMNRQMRVNAFTDNIDFIARPQHWDAEYNNPFNAKHFKFSVNDYISDELIDKFDKQMQETNAEEEPIQSLGNDDVND